MKSLTKISYLTNENSLAEYIHTIYKIANKNTVAIVAGHFMLGYEPAKHELLPLIKEEKNSLQSFSDLVAKNFPLQSFNIGLRLFELFLELKVPAKILLLVNDHKFQDSMFQVGIEEKIKDKAGELRKAYYRHIHAVPKIYKTALSKRGLTISDVFLENNDINRQEIETLPAENLLFSEYILQKRFKRHTIKQYIEEGIFYETDTGQQQKNVLYKSEKQTADYCIVGFGHIGCIGIAIELLLAIVKKGINDIILIIPNECAVQTNQAAEVCLKLAKQRIRMTIINNIEYSSENITVSEYEKDISP